MLAYLGRTLAGSKFIKVVSSLSTEFSAYAQIFEFGESVSCIVAVPRVFELTLNITVLRATHCCRHPALHRFSFLSMKLCTSYVALPDRLLAAFYQLLLIDCMFSVFFFSFVLGHLQQIRSANVYPAFVLLQESRSSAATGGCGNR